MVTKKVAIITAASKGMGKAIAEKLAEENFKLILMARSEAIYPVADALGARPLLGSVDSEKDLSRLVELAQEKYGRIDVVVNNTGHVPKGDLLSLTDQDWELGLQMLLLNVIRMTRYVAPMMTELGIGSIINISTFGAKQPSLAFPISSAMRSALSSFTKMFANQYAKNGIRMNNVLPGYINSYPADESTIAGIPQMRQGSPKEVAELVAFLASEKSSYITGQDLLIDGGLVAGI